jgi:putative DNA primase/helicase
MARLPHAMAPEDIEPGKRYRFSTNGKRQDKSGWCLLFTDGGSGIFGCWRTGFTQVWTAQHDRPLTAAQKARHAREAAQAKRQREVEQCEQQRINAKRLASLWSESHPVAAGDPVALYLGARLRMGWGEVAPLIDAEVIRFHPALAYLHDDGTLTRHPGMVAAMRSRTGRLVSVHRTFLTDAGRKADVPQVKKLMPTAGELSGACIRLGAPNAEGRIGVAEGIETAMAARMASSLPVAAAYSAAGLESWQWPGSTRTVIVFADNDKAGQRAAEHLRRRVLQAGLKVSVLCPSKVGTDWCDAWAHRDASEVTA